MQLSQRIRNITPSQTLAITAKSRELKAQGVDVISLSAGEPDFNTPEEIIEKTYKALNEGQTKYTSASGINELKEAIVRKMKDDNGLDYDASEIFVGSGAKHVLYNLFQATLDAGDEVLIPTPYWVSYTEQVKLAEGKPVIMHTDESTSFKMTPEIIEAHRTDKTRMLLLNSPSNPSGMVYTEEELKNLAEYLEKTDIVVVADEIYETLVYDRPHISIASFSDKMKQNTIVINGVSKSHAMTGWRIGYACGDRDVMKAMTDLTSHSTSNPATPSQWAAVAAYEMDPSYLEEYNRTFNERRDRAYEKLMEIPYIDCIKPEGAFYLFPNFKECAQKCGFQDVDQFVTALLEEQYVAVVPGSGFGSPDNIRLSYSLSIEDMAEALDRIRKFVEQHTKGA
ncbi:pyridoxal phosphate-dependent aminotransferase [Salinicoccus sp. ID82-1]|uniref:pyridoxal phosphate-dependent aminotransferase n=1 Tax=Salinicoccus sp. ID82-1 TaxID=2820269 RepID=UPI001F1AB9F4|nr:pyridoxal phosphate-dependent aminotransferase [Salinicoccus sp. ID82-1]MCG1009110.1 pyridoxal phosphate-dependent aminotransferase [Salinicoccus sp. ID82-1]